MTERLDLYKATITKVGGGVSETFAISPTKHTVPCMVQNAVQETKDDYSKRQLVVTNSIYLIDSVVYGLVDVSDRIVTGGSNYLVIGKKNLAGRSRVFRIDVREEKWP